LYGDCGLRGVYSDGQVIKGDLHHVLRNPRGTPARIGKRLEVGDQQRLRTLALDGQSRAQRAGVVPEMERTRRTIASEYDVGCVGLAPRHIGARGHENVRGHGVRLLGT
jgi:hypothetical protein